jgi:CheY-like chemotaxis protein
MPSPSSCPRCHHSAIVGLGRAGSTREWYSCNVCRHVWADGVTPAVMDPALTSGPGPAEPAPPGFPKHVLVVDDDTLILTLVERALEGYRVSTARDATEALARLATTEWIDLLITDYLMPVMTGDELVGRAKVKRPDLKVLVLTGHAEAIENADPSWWASERHVDKPFRVDELRGMVRDLIGAP